jgi:hypothetical protein
MFLVDKAEGGTLLTRNNDDFIQRLSVIHVDLVGLGRRCDTDFPVDERDHNVYLFESVYDVYTRV